MPCTFTLDYWLDDGWYVGKLREVPVCSARARAWLNELKANIQDAYRLMTEDAPPLPVTSYQSTEVQVGAV